MSQCIVCNRDNYHEWWYEYPYDNMTIKSPVCPCHEKFICPLCHKRLGRSRPFFPLTECFCDKFKLIKTGLTDDGFIKYETEHGFSYQRILN
jgi:hypothetical protein